MSKLREKTIQEDKTATKKQKKAFSNIFERAAKDRIEEEMNRQTIEEKHEAVRIHSGAEGGASAIEHKEEERLDSKALIDAASRGELARVKEIIQGMKTNGVDINHQDSDGDTASIWACYNGRKEVVLELLKVDGLDVNIQSRNGYTALMMACVSNSLEVVIELLKVDGLKANLQSSDERTALV